MNHRVDEGGNVMEVATFMRKDGVSAAAFAPLDKAVEQEHAARQPGFVSRESAWSADGERLVIVHWQSEKNANTSMASFEKAPAAAAFMSGIEASAMRMKRFEE